MKEYPYFIPGYTGFCPEIREHYGQTYGYATRHIIQKKPHLKERLAPVHYRYRRYERTSGTLGKYLGKERDKYDNSKAKHRADHLDGSEVKHRTDYNVGDAEKEFYHLDYGDGDIHRGKCYRNCESIYQPSVKHTSICTHGDKIRKTDHEYPCPKYIFIQGFAECVEPEIRASEDRRKLPNKHYPCVTTPCVHVREHCISPKKCPMPKPNNYMNEYHPTGCGHKKDANMGADGKMRKGQRVKPHRQGGVIPKYTGHVPGMQFSFGESYGPISNRLLQKHHNRMKEIKIKS